jgi:hypothetical protein
VATLADLIAAINTALQLPSSGQLLRLNNQTRERAFEAYVLGLLVRAVRQAGGTPTTWGITSGQSPNIFVCRGAPGRLGSTSSDYGYVRCDLENEHFEIHLDVQYEGKSSAIHEIDVSIYESAAAERARQSQNFFPKVNKLIGAIECKFYDSRLGTSLGRTFVGLVADCGTLRLKCFITNGSSPSLAKYFQPSPRPGVHLRVSPLRLSDETRLVHYFEAELRRWAKVNV